MIRAPSQLSFPGELCAGQPAYIVPQSSSCARCKSLPRSYQLLIVGYPRVLPEMPLRTCTAPERLVCVISLSHLNSQFHETRSN